MKLTMIKPCHLEQPTCAVCPECGYTETYIQDTSKVKKLTLNKKEK